MKILTIVGARPQFVKAATFSRAVSKDSTVEEILVHTGQHFDANMSEVFFEEMQIPKPAYNLGISSMSHGAMTGKMLAGIEELIQKENPDVLLVYGDTNSTLAGALAARKIHVPVGHVEAGLRSFNMEMPEEVNRILTDRISNFLFCPTDSAVANLKREGFDHFDADVVRTGDVMLDAALFYAAQSAEKSTIGDKIPTGDFAVCTLHRAENTDSKSRLKEIVDGLNRIHREMPVILPLHPRTKKMLAQHGLRLQVEVIEPVGYFDMIALLQRASVVLTDSGGLQKEAFFFKTPCVTIRDQTEWIELVDRGFNILANADADDILKKCTAMRNKDLNFDVDLYGNGHAAEEILVHLKSRL